MTDEIEYLRADLPAIATWVTHFLKAPHGARGQVSIGIAADTNEPLIILEFDGHEVAIEWVLVPVLVRTLMRDHPSAGGLCMAIAAAANDIAQHQGRTLH